MSKDSQTHTRSPKPDSNARKISPYDSQLQKPVGIESMEETVGASKSSSCRTHRWT